MKQQKYNTLYINVINQQNINYQTCLLHFPELSLILFLVCSGVLHPPGSLWERISIHLPSPPLLRTNLPVLRHRGAT